MGAFLTYALDEGGALVHVDDVAKGAKCACRCPHCNAPLYAKNGGRWPEPGTRIHHFAHAQGHECEGAYESSLHLLAKEILQETGRIMLPKSSGSFFPSGSVRIRNIEIEKWDDRYGIRPDAEGIMDNGERLLIEFYVSHKVDNKKRQIIVDNHLKCIEIDINYQALDKAELKEFLAGTDEDRKWIVSIPSPPQSKGESFSYGRNPMYEKARDILKAIFDKGSIIIHPFSTSFFHQDKPFDLRQVVRVDKGRFVQRNRSGSNARQSVDAAQQCAFPRTGRADDRDGFTFRNRKINIVERSYIGILFDDILHNRSILRHIFYHLSICRQMLEVV